MERAEPTAVHWDGRSLSLHAGTSAGCSHGTGKGAHMWRLNYSGQPVRWLKGNGSLAKKVC
jgi:hypothetical protein